MNPVFEDPHLLHRFPLHAGNSKEHASRSRFLVEPVLYRQKHRDDSGGYQRTTDEAQNELSNRQSPDQRQQYSKAGNDLLSGSAGAGCGLPDQRLQASASLQTAHSPIHYSECVESHRPATARSAKPSASGTSFRASSGSYRDRQPCSVANLVVGSMPLG